jgi:hypothetical protein
MIDVIRQSIHYAIHTEALRPPSLADKLGLDMAEVLAEAEAILGGEG